MTASCRSPDVLHPPGYPAGRRIKEQGTRQGSQPRNVADDLNRTETRPGRTPDRAAAAGTKPAANSGRAAPIDSVPDPA